MMRAIKITSAEVESFVITFNKNSPQGKNKPDTCVEIELYLNGKLFKHNAWMWQFEVSDYLASFGAEI